MRKSEGFVFVLQTHWCCCCRLLLTFAVFRDKMLFCCSCIFVRRYSIALMAFFFLPHNNTKSRAETFHSCDFYSDRELRFFYTLMAVRFVRLFHLAASTLRNFLSFLVCVGRVVMG